MIARSVCRTLGLSFMNRSSSVHPWRSRSLGRTMRGGQLMRPGRTGARCRTTPYHDENLVHGGSDFEGGRYGTIQTAGNARPHRHTGQPPVEKGRRKATRPSPELAVRGAYSACYQGALGNAPKSSAPRTEISTVRALVSLIEDDQGGLPPGG